MTVSHDRQAGSILIVDDTAANLNVLCGILRERGYKARPVPSGELALQAAAASPPDLILLDIDMPSMTGYEVCERLKADAALASIPVIFISALNEIDDKVRAFAVGGVDYITKPFHFGEVHARVATHLKLGRQQRELQESYDRLRALEALRDSLVHMLVHDLRSPLTALTMFLAFLKEDAAPALAPEQRDDIDQAINATQRMVLMVSSVLDVNKLEAGQMTLQVAECDTMALAREVLGSLGPLAQGRTLSLRPQTGVGGAWLDRGVVYRVMQNLVANALAFAPAHGGEVVVELDRVEDGIRFQVRDNGPGIAAEHHERIFDKFGQVGDPTQRTVFSTGLGLPFCKLAVEAHGGRIGVESDVGKGATFWFVLPERPA